MDWHKFHQFMNYAHEKTLIPRHKLVISMLLDSVRYNISLLEFFQFKFYEIRAKEKMYWAGTGFMYEFQLIMNPKEHRDSIANKIIFFECFKNLAGREYATLSDVKLNKRKAKELLKDSKGKIVLKDSMGGSGIGVEVIEIDGLDLERLSEIMEETGNDLVEEYVEQHDDLKRLSPSGLNTLRIITQINKDGKVNIIASRLRISVNSNVDNMAAGNLVTVVDSDAGVVTSKGYYSDITLEPVVVHPITRQRLIGFEIPFWSDVVEMVEKAALQVAEHNRSIGWDIGVTKKGPVLIEGNHDWCKLVWQLPEERGLKHELEIYLNQY